MVEVLRSSGVVRGRRGWVMAPSLGIFPALSFLLLALPVPRCLALECKEHQYFYHDRCCSDCAPGQRMTSRCTATADTVCAPCQDEYFSSEHHHSFCSSCTLCNTKKGSVEVKKCEKTSDRVCVCRAGFMPDGTPLGSVCSPCPEGTFSVGRNEKCQPWTNCSSLGKITLRAGTEAQDALCSPVTVPEAPESPTPALSVSSTAPRDHRGNSSVVPPSRPEESPSLCPDTDSSPETNWGSLSLLLICLTLLLVSGMSILLLIIHAARKDTKRKPCRNNHSKESCRIPIQEEQADSNSSLIKN